MGLRPPECISYSSFAQKNTAIAALANTKYKVL